MRRSLLLLFLFLLPFFGSAQFYYGSQQQFGKNRVQYNKFFWSYYRFDRFDVYLYEKGKPVAEYTARMAEENLKQMEKYLDYKMDSRIQILVFNSLTDLKQSNLNISTDEAYNSGGVTRLVGSKMFVYFDGDHNKLLEQIRAGLAQVLLENMIYGGSIREAVRSSTLINLPDWYLEGLVSFLSTPWNVEIDNAVRDGFLQKKFKNFNRLSGSDARYAGHSLWNYIVNTYGMKVIPHINYMTLINRNVESGFLFVLGTGLNTVLDDWMRYYGARYNQVKGLEMGGTTLKRSKKEIVFKELNFSPERRYFAYVQYDLGRYKVMLNDTKKKSQKSVRTDGHRISQNLDRSHPLLAWHPNGQILSMIYEAEGYVHISFYDLKKKRMESRPLYQFDKVLDYSYSEDGRLLLMSAVKKGQSDIFLYDIVSNTFEQITNDIFDDLYPTFVNGMKEIVFSSNRTITDIKVPDSIKDVGGNLDLYWYNIESKAAHLRQITKTDFVNEIEAKGYDYGYFSYLSAGSGTQNRNMVRMDSAVAYVDTITHYKYLYEDYPITDFKTNILQHDINVQSEKIGYVTYFKGRYYLKEEPFLLASEWEAVKGRKMNQDKEEVVPRNFEVEFKSVPIEEDIEFEIDINNYTFSPELNERYKLKDEPEKPDPEKKEAEPNASPEEILPPTEPLIKPFKLPQQRNFVTAFFPSELTSQFDNSFINHSYQQFTGGGALFLNPSFNALFSISLDDLMENYKILGAFRISLDFENNEFYIVLRDIKSRYDKELVLHRRSQRSYLAFSLLKTITHEASYSLKYPFSEVLALKGTGSLRYDHNIVMSTDIITLQRPDFFKYWTSVKLELIYDNTREMGINLYRGARWKIFSEFYQNLNSEGYQMITVGADFRKYIRVHRTIIWANRLAGGTSFGTQKLAYFMGGVDNWFSPRYDYTTPIDFSQNYGFQTLATNMRGHAQNIRNGNSFMVINSELRVPIFRYLFNRPIRSDFFNNFQIIGFGDIGTAWTGLTPYSDENFLNIETIQQGSISVAINTQVEPIVMGYGFGLRTRMLGYFVKADWGWGWEDGVVYPARFYVSLGYDF